MARTKTAKSVGANSDGNRAPETAAEQRAMILSTFCDDDDTDGTHCLALIDHCRIDLAACGGEVKQVPNIIAAHYRIAKGRYDIDRAAHDLFTFPPVAARIAELKAQRARRERKTRARS